MYSFITCSIKNGWGRPDPFYHMNVVWLPVSNVLILCFETGAVRFSLGKRSKVQSRKQDKALSLYFFDQGPLPPSVYLGRQNVIHGILQMIKTGQWEG